MTMLLVLSSAVNIKGSHAVSHVGSLYMFMGMAGQISTSPDDEQAGIMAQPVNHHNPQIWQSLLDLDSACIS